MGWRSRGGLWKTLAGKPAERGDRSCPRKDRFGWSFTGRRWERNPGSTSWDLLGQKKGEEGTCPQPPAFRIDWSDRGEFERSLQGTGPWVSERLPGRPETGGRHLQNFMTFVSQQETKMKRAVSIAFPREEIRPGLLGASRELEGLVLFLKMAGELSVTR